MANAPNKSCERGSWVSFLLHDLDFLLYSVLALIVLAGGIFVVGREIYSDAPRPWFVLYCGLAGVTVISAFRDAVHRRFGPASRLLVGLWALTFIALLIGELAG